nr:TolC family protein [Verrucomicrobiota bacterium]
QRQRLENNVRAQSDRYQVGHADRQALNIARVLEGEVNPRVAEAQRTSSGALLTLARAMGEDLGPKTALPTVASDLTFASVSIDVNAETAAAIARRPDLQLARLLVAAAREDQRIIEAAYFPAIDATVSGDYIPVTQIHRGSEGTAQRLDDTVSSQISAGAAYTWRVVDNGQVIGAAIQQRAAREANQLVVEKLEAQVPRELTQLRNNLRALQARHDALTKASEVAQRNVTDVQANVVQGRSSQLEYRTAESSYLQSQAGLLGVAYEQNLALAERDRLTGRYFQFSDDTKAKLH